jgi:hypothetical protein
LLIVSADSIKAKLVELNWTEQDFPDVSDPGYRKWYSLVRQPKDLTPRSKLRHLIIRDAIINAFIVWTSINGKLQDILRTKRQATLERERLDRLALRKLQFTNIWKGFVRSVPGDDVYTLPSAADAWELPSVAKALEEDGVDFTEGKWKAMLCDVWPEIEEYRKKVKRELVSLLKAKGNRDVAKDIYSSIGDADFEVLDDASSLFNCHSCGTLLTYPTLLAHGCFKKLRLGWDIGLVGFKPEIERLVKDVLDALLLPEGITHVQLDGSQKKFLCACGNPPFTVPMDFPALVGVLVVLTVLLINSV